VDLGGRTPVAIALAPPTLLCFELDATDDSVARLRVSGVR
jgi:hypothetical protein